MFERSVWKRLGYALASLVCLVIFIACSGVHLNPLNPGSGNSTGSVSIAFACLKLDDRGTATRSFTYTMAPDSISGTTGKTTTDNGSQPEQGQPAASQLVVDGIHPAVFSWVISGYAYGTWTLTLHDNTGWVGTTKVTMTSDNPIQQANFDSARDSAVVSNEVSNSQYP